MSLFRKKPVVIEAEQFLPGDGVRVGVDTFSAHGKTWTILDSSIVGPHVEIETAEGVMMAGYGDWIIKGVKGELYPCKPDIFDLTYEPVEESK